jgi:hypothetical protein
LHVVYQAVLVWYEILPASRSRGDQNRAYDQPEETTLSLTIFIEQFKWKTQPHSSQTDNFKAFFHG